MLLAHGVGRVYESPLPLEYYLVGAAGTVVVSFFLRSLRGARGDRSQRRIGGPGAAAAVRGVFRVVSLIVVLAILVLGVVYADDAGFTLVPLMFWVLFIFGTTLVCTIAGGMWDDENPWATGEAMVVSSGDPDWDEDRDRAPVWVGPLLVFLLFWLELVSGVGFQPVVLVGVLLAYSLYYLTCRRRFGAGWALADPLGILFGFASRCAPLEVRRDAVVLRGFVAGLDEKQPMPAPLFASVFVLLGATTLDNLRETVSWHRALDSLGVSTVDPRLVDTVALLVLVVPFLVPFLGAVALGRPKDAPPSLLYLARRYSWSLIPIGIAYVLAHNMPLLITGIPVIADDLTNAFGLSLFDHYIPSPLLVWVLEIALVVGGHVVAVLAAQRVAEDVAGSGAAAFRSHLWLTVLMASFTVGTLWLLSLPIVAA